MRREDIVLVGHVNQDPPEYIKRWFFERATCPG